jgi:predicted alpha/beta-fold hydrolase
VTPYFTTPFVPARGLQSPHAQTLLGALRRPTEGPPTRRERWVTPDEDFLDVDVLPAAASAPTVVLFHGLEGSSRSGYMLQMLRAAAARAWGAVAVNFRSCSGEPNRFARSYNAGDTADARWVLERIRRERPGPLFAAGFSLGGNVLARLLAELGADSGVSAAAVISAPFDLAACARQIDLATPLARLYRWWYLRTLLAKARDNAAAHPEAPRPESFAGVRTLEGYDDAVTAPLWGFPSAAAYYAANSSGPVLGRIRTRTWILSAQDDPLAPARQIPADAAANPALELCRPEGGGHVGFLAGSAARPRWWAEEQVAGFFETAA